MFHGRRLALSLILFAGSIPVTFIEGSQHRRIGAPKAQNLGTEEHDRSKECLKVLWFITLRATHDGPYNEYAQAALLSAKQHAPSLVPHLVWFGPPNSMTAWFELNGGTVIFHELSFYEKLPEVKKGLLSGKYLRFDIPDIVATLAASEDVDYKFVLYTDADVMFYRDFNSCSINKPRIIALGAEFDRNTKANSGVIYMNVSGFDEHRDPLLAFALKKGFENFPGVNDQGVLLGYFNQSQISQLPDIFNWKPYWGGDAIDITILHFHGPKPKLSVLWKESPEAGGLDCFLEHRMDYQSKCSDVADVYKHVFGLTPDKGRYYNAVLQDFYKYITKARSIKSDI